jgi:hypothetical protein
VAPVYRNFTKDYHVENDLIFNGTLEVASEKENRLLNNNDLVMGGEELYWSGLRPVYQNSFGVYPPENEFDITIWDGIGNHWSTSPAAGEFFQLKTNAQDNTNLEGDLHIINITGIPPTSDTSNTSFSIRIDGDNVSFSNATPNNRTWHMDESIYVGITIEDYGGGLVDGNSIMYAISTDNGESYDDWLPIPTLKDETILATQTLATFANGRNNYIKWLALDSLGNGPTDSQPYRILIDTEEVIFSNPWPAAKYLSFSSMVEVGINISDNLSGVNGSKIEYSISENDGQTWNNWISVDPIENSNNLSVRLNITLSPGSKNRIRWRAYDVAGNGPTKSEEYIINIWSFMEKKPEIELISPPKGSIFGNTSVELIWNVTNLDIPGITYIVVLDSFDPPYNVLQDMITTLNFKVENLWDKTTYYWKIVPVIDGIEYREISSDVWWFSVDLSKPPLEKLYNVLINGKDFVSLYPGENVNITLQITNLGETRDSIKVRIQSSNISTFARWEKTYPLALSPNESGNRTLLLNLPDDIHLGFYEIFVEAYSLYSEDRVNDSHLITVEVKKFEIPEPPPDKTTDSISIWIILVIIVSIVLAFILISVLIRKHRSKKKLQTKDTVTIKPLETPTPKPTLEKPQIAQPDAQIPAKPILDTPSQLTPSTTSKPTLAPLPTIDHVAVEKQMPEVKQKPQPPLVGSQLSKKGED